MRERDRILVLCSVMEARTTLRDSVQVSAKARKLVYDCWELLKSHLTSQMMLYDSDEVANCVELRGDLKRSESLDKISQKYCF